MFHNICKVKFPCPNGVLDDPAPSVGFLPKDVRLIKIGCVAGLNGAALL